jgi:ADP-ribose pyrophosphatase YjhB (NUDIX family)
MLYSIPVTYSFSVESFYAMKNLLRTNTKIPWMPTNSEARLYQTDVNPPVDICGTAFAFAFIEDMMLLTRLVKRGWDIPGGHIETGESPEQAVIRETIEETQVVVEPLELVGVQELEVFGSLPRDGWTAPLSTQLFYLCRVIEILPFIPTRETTERDFLPPDIIRDVPTMINHDLLYDIALKRIQGRRVK